MAEGKVYEILTKEFEGMDKRANRVAIALADFVQQLVDNQRVGLGEFRDFLEKQRNG